MLKFLGSAWPLLFGVLLLLAGNGLQGTLLGVRGGIEGYPSETMGYVMATYFVGFLVGSWMTPILLQRVGHVRVFAALGSVISAAFILYAEMVDPIAWALLRLSVGACFAGVYIVSESWLNDIATNETRGKALSAYLIAQMAGIIGAQALLLMADPAGYTLFVVMSVLVSLSFLPILLNAGPAPMFQTARRMPLGKLFRTSPLGCVGTFLLGGVFACQFGMGSVYGTERGLDPAEISLFIGIAYVGGMVMQFPIGGLSDRMDRRRVIIGTAIMGAAGSLIGLVFGGVSYWALVVAMFFIGSAANPLYSLLIAHTNDFLEHDDMASASGGLIFLNGLGAMGTPIAVGYVMGWTGPAGFFGVLLALLAAIAGYGLWRATRRRARAASETGSAVLYTHHATPVAAGIAQEAQPRTEPEPPRPAAA